MAMITSMVVFHDQLHEEVHCIPMRVNTQQVLDRNPADKWQEYEDYQDTWTRPARAKNYRGPGKKFDKRPQGIKRNH